MKNLKSNIILSTLFSAVALMTTATHAAESNKLQEAYKSTNVKSALINVCKDETGKSKTEVFKSAIYFTEIDADLVDEIISNIGYYASEKNWEGVKEEVHRYVLYRTQK